MSDAIIQVEHVSKRFGQMLAVDDVTVDVPRGRCFAWLGPNGCGKTTLIRMMLGLARPTAGRIRLRGCDCRTTSATRSRASAGSSRSRASTRT
ncbi:MAG: ATP-binding cassette domain-containing protein [Actinomycetota bacterium]|nr:ATP-binding cassette domain-containing protein [Actinomycetota bacterium]